MSEMITRVWDGTEWRQVFGGAVLGEGGSAQLDSHIANTNNPHAVTKAQVGLGNVSNTSDAAKPVSTAQQAALDAKAALVHTHDDRYYTEAEIATLLSTKADASALSAKASQTSLDNHINDINNPHFITPFQVGLGNVSNTSDADKPISTATQSALDAKANTSHTHAQSDITGLTTALAGKAAVSHTHDDRYYTESEVATLLAAKAAVSHTHSGLVPSGGSTNSILAKDSSSSYDYSWKVMPLQYQTGVSSNALRAVNIPNNTEYIVHSLTFNYGSSTEQMTYYIDGHIEAYGSSGTTGLGYLYVRLKNQSGSLISETGYLCQFDQGVDASHVANDGFQVAPTSATDVLTVQLVLKVTDGVMDIRSSGLTALGMPLYIGA